MGRHKVTLLRDKRELYAERAASGVCVKCGLHAARPGKRKCQACAEKYNVWKRANDSRIRNAVHSLGLCPKCHDNERVPGEYYCAHCAELMAERKRIWRQNRIAAGMCSKCGKVPPIEGKKACAECKARAYASNRASSQKKRKACREKGICIVCMKREAAHGCVSCEYCINMNIEYQQKRREAAKEKNKGFIEIEPDALKSFDYNDHFHGKPMVKK